VAVSACGDDGIDYDGTAGEPTPARFDAWVPAIDLSAASGDLDITGNVIVDTGAPFTILDVDTYGYEDGKAATTLTGFGLTFPDYPVIAYDVFDQSTGDYDGLLGGDLLRHFALSLDYKGSLAWLRDADTTALPSGVSGSFDDAVSIPFVLRGGGTGLVPGNCPGGCGTVSVAATRILLEVELEGSATPVWFLVDTGASISVLSEELLQELGDPARPRLDGVSVATVNGIVSAYLSRVSSIVIAGDGEDAGPSQVTHVSSPVLVVPGWDLFGAIQSETGVQVRGLIGGSFLRSFLTTLDYTSKRLRLSRYVEPSHLDPDEFVRVGFTLSPVSGQWRVVDVYDNTDAEAEGLVAGDVVLEIDGTAITGLDESAVGNLLGAFGQGQEVPIGIQVGGGVQTVDVMIEDLLPAYE